MGVTAENFIWFCIYISFINSLLEEFFFRGFAFLTLSQVGSRKLAYHFSALAFAIYHVAMMIGWFHIGLIILSIFGLYIGGLIFNYFNHNSQTIYTSWVIHISANFAINLIGFSLFTS